MARKISSPRNPFTKYQSSPLNQEAMQNFNKSMYEFKQKINYANKKTLEEI